MTRGRQRGISILGWLVILVGIGAVAMLSLRIVPHYIDYYTIEKIVQALPSDQVHTMSKTALREALLKRFLINNIRDLNVSEVIDIERKREITVLHVHYERREPLVYNASVVLTFDKQFEFH
jgi:hypothetical protein